MYEGFNTSGSLQPSLYIAIEAHALALALAENLPTESVIHGIKVSSDPIVV